MLLHEGCEASGLQEGSQSTWCIRATYKQCKFNWLDMTWHTWFLIITAYIHPTVSIAMNSQTQKWRLQCALFYLAYCQSLLVTI